MNSNSVKRIVYSFYFELIHVYVLQEKKNDLKISPKQSFVFRFSFCLKILRKLMICQQATPQEVAKYPEIKTNDPTVKFLLWENYAEQKIMKFFL